MTKRSYAILQKKLKELESELKQAVSLPPETPYCRRFSQDIQQRFLFLRNLLSAEMACGPRKPYNLKRLGQKLLELEAAFQEWDSFQNSTPVRVENGSTCSCTESCFNDDGDTAEGSSELMSLADLEQVGENSTDELRLADLDLEGFDGLVPVPVASVENVENIRNNEADEKEKRKEEERVWVEAEKSMLIKEKSNGFGYGKCWGTLASGVVLGMVLMAFFLVRYCGCFPCYYASGSVSTFCLSPT